MNPHQENEGGTQITLWSPLCLLQEDLTSIQPLAFAPDLVCDPFRPFTPIFVSNDCLWTRPPKK